MLGGAIPARAAAAAGSGLQPLAQLLGGLASHRQLDHAAQARRPRSSLAALRFAVWLLHVIHPRPVSLWHFRQRIFARHVGDQAVDPRQAHRDIPDPAVTGRDAMQMTMVSSMARTVVRQGRSVNRARRFLAFYCGRKNGRKAGFGRFRAAEIEWPKMRKVPVLLGFLLVSAGNRTLDPMIKRHVLSSALGAGSVQNNRFASASLLPLTLM